MKKTKRVRTVLLGLLLSWTPASAQEVARVVVLHTNDLHGQMLPYRATWIDRNDPPLVGGVAAIGAYVSRVRDEGDRKGFGVLLLDGGDWYQGTPEGNRTKGAAFVEWMNRARYDAATLGNHEFDFGVGNVRRLLDLARFPVLGANVREAKTGEIFPGLEPFVVVERKGVRFGIAGLLTEETPKITMDGATEGVRFLPAVEEVAALVARAREKSDVVLLLTHCGIETDRALAAAAPDVPLVVGGHSHTPLREPARVGDTLVVQAGSRGGSIGRVDLEIERESKRVRSARSTLVDLRIDVVGEDEEAARIVARETEAVREEMDAPVGTLLGELSRTREARSSLAGNFVADATRAAADADVGFMNKGGLRTTLPAGPVTRRGLFELLPFENTIVAMTLTGEEILAILRESSGGSGKSPLEVSGLRVTVEGAGSTAKLEVEVGGRPLDPRREYRVAVNSFLAGGGDGYVGFRAGRDREDTEILLREAAARWLAEHSPLDPASEERIDVRSSPSRRGPR
jgi:2',3'-cyclic-nucleotide 2'-phosphodiesterase (5'-nucleotidase family)